MTSALDNNREATRNSLWGQALGFYRAVRDASLLDVVPILSLCLLIFHGFPSSYASYFSPVVTFLALPALRRAASPEGSSGSPPGSP